MHHPTHALRSLRRAETRPSLEQRDHRADRSRCSALFASSLYLLRLAPGHQNNATYTQVQAFNTNQYDIKIDYNATSKDHISGRYSHAKQHNPTTNSFALRQAVFRMLRSRMSAVDWSHTFSSNSLNDVRVSGINHVRLHNGPTFNSAAAATLGTDLGIAGANANRPGLLFLDFDHRQRTADERGDRWIEQKFQDAVIQASDAAVITHNRHVFTPVSSIGATASTPSTPATTERWVKSSSTGNLHPTNPAGTSHSGGYGGADFYLGLADEYQRGIPGGEWGQRASIFGAYSRMTGGPPIV